MQNHDIKLPDYIYICGVIYMTLDIEVYRQASHQANVTLYIDYVMQVLPHCQWLYAPGIKILSLQHSTAIISHSPIKHFIIIVFVPHLFVVTWTDGGKMDFS